MSLKASVLGGCVTVSFIAIGAGVFATLYPTESTFGPLARILDSHSPWLFLAGALLAVAVLALGAFRIGAGLIALALFSAGLLYLSYLPLSVPILNGRDAELRVLFFNVQSHNTEFGDRIVERAIETSSDVIVFAEASPVLPSLDRLKGVYEFVSPCEPEDCELLVASNLKVKRFWRLGLNPIWDKRYAVLEFNQPDGTLSYFVASHLVKPWMSGVSEAETEQLIAQYNWLSGPVVAVGDFNMAPWSNPMRGLLEETGMRATRGQPATWPASAGLFGIPIDQVLVRGGARVVRVSSFGRGLNSNHLGFVADVVFEP